MMIKVSVGEMLDKLTILLIKMKKIKDPVKRSLIQIEKEYLETLITPEMLSDPSYQLLARTNEKLWEIEDEIRNLELEKQFEKEFIDLARSVYRENDKRFHYKNQLNQRFDSDFMEIKSYSNYLPIYQIDSSRIEMSLEELKILLKGYKIIYKGNCIWKEELLTEYPNIEFI